MAGIGAALVRHLLTTNQLLLFAAVSLLLSASVSLAAIFLDVVGFRHFDTRWTGQSWSATLPWNIWDTGS